MKKTHKLGCFLALILFLSSLYACAPPPALQAEEIGFSLLETEARAPVTQESENEEAPIGIFTTPTEEESSSLPQAEEESPPAPQEEEGISTPFQEKDPPPIPSGLPEEESAPSPPIYTPPATDYTLYDCVCARTTVNVRSGASTSYAIVGYLRMGGSLPYLWAEGDWYAVWLTDRVAYVNAYYSYISGTTAAVERVISAGLDKLGTPYLWGAPRLIGADGRVNPYFNGESFDCSSFVQYCYYIGDGVKLGNYTGSQADYTVGRVLSRYDELRRGDFYFTGNGSISHVVIYMGGGYLLQAYSANGGPVSFTTDDRWRGKFISGRRVDFTIKEQYR